MALQVWLPLNGNLNNQGLSNINFNSYTGGSFSVNNNGKIGKCYSGCIVKHLTEEFLGNTWSIALWVNSISAWSQYNDIMLCKNTDGSGSCQFYMSVINGATFNIGVNSGSGTTSVAYTFATNTWYHLCVTFNGQQICMYINGILMKTTANTSSQLTGKLNLGIGCRSTNSAGTSITGTSKLFNDVRIYDHCLSPREVHSISQALILHYRLDDAYAKSVTNYSGQGNCSGWNNSGTATRTNDDISVPNIPRTSAKTVSITQTADGQSALTFGSTTQNLPSKELTASVWFWWAGSYDGNSISPYIRSSKTDGNVANLLYNGSNNFRNWPQNTWIKLTTTFTSASDATTFYFCTYTSKTNQKFAFNAWQIEDGNTDSEFVNGSRSSSGIVYDDSGYQNDGNITGSLQIVNSEARYRKCGKVTDTGRIIYPFPHLQVFSYSLWFKRSRVSYSNREMLGAGWYGVSMELNTNNTLTFRHQLTSGTFDVITTKTFTSTSDWYFITLTRDAAGVSKIYVNGELEKSGTNSNQINYTATTAELFTYSGSSYQFRGCISDFRIYATALSAEDVKSLYNVGAVIDNGANMHTYEYHEIESTTPKVHRTGVTDSSAIIEPDTITNASFSKAGIIKAKNFYEI